MQHATTTEDKEVETDYHQNFQMMFLDDALVDLGSVSRMRV